MTMRKNHAARVGLALYCTALLGLGGYVLADAFLIPRQLEAVGITAADLAAEGGATVVSGEAAANAPASSEGVEPTAWADGSSDGASDTGGTTGGSHGHGRHGGHHSSTNASQTSNEGTASATTAASADASSVGDARTYTSDELTITLTTQRVNGTTVYVADVRLSSVEALRTAFAQGTYGRNVKATVSEMAEQNDAILAINGDYYGWRDAGYVLRNGMLYRETSNGNDALVIGSDGTMYAAAEGATGARELLASGAWQVLSFGPVLVRDGAVAVSENAEVGQAMGSNPRTAIGMVEPLHYVLVVSDGRTNESEGLSLYELAQVMRDAGCTFAYNLDGGGSSTLWFDGEVINNPTSGRSSGEREVSDIVYVAR